MYDLRDYKQVIREAVKRESRADANWNWKLLAVNKTEVKIGWGYTDWLGEREPFRVRLYEDTFDGELSEPDLSLAGFFPGDKSVGSIDEDVVHESLFVWIGDKHWHDAKTLEDGLKVIIHCLAWEAKNRY